MKTINKNILLVVLLIVISSFTISNKRFNSENEKESYYRDSVLLEKAKQILNTSIKKFETVNNYKAVIVSTEIIKGKRNDTEYILTKFMSPNSIYLRWLPGLYEGMQVSYVPSRDGKKSFRGLEKGFAGILGEMKLKNSSMLVNTLYPHHFTPQETSLKYFIDMSQLILKNGIKKNAVKIISISTVIDKYLKRRATKIVVKLSDDPKDNLLWPKMDLYFDQETKLPLHFRLYSFEGGLSGEYAFTNFKENINITSGDFELKKIEQY